MSESISNVASTALGELLEVSPQVEASVVLVREDGRMLASAPSTMDRAGDRFAATCMSILDAAERARADLGREPVTQVEIATPNGHVFVVADTAHVVAAVTNADPTVGLVFYDLKTALRAVRDAAQLTSEPASDAEPEVTVVSNGNGEPTKSGRWRKKKSS